MTYPPSFERIRTKIRVPSRNDPNNPEFPPQDPQFPATPTRKIIVPDFKNVYLKDESLNPTGTHKDRMAWEVVVCYKRILEERKRRDSGEPLPQFSIISSGSAAIAIQTMFNHYGLPKLKVLVDSNIDRRIHRELETLGCEVYEEDLSRKVFEENDILAATDNANGYDITSSEGLDPNSIYYDWLSYEILNENPNYILIPYGTGNLYENIINIVRTEAERPKGEVRDPRFRAKIWTNRDCHYIGATTRNPKTLADKLFAHKLPYSHFGENDLRLFKDQGFLGAQSGIYELKSEEYLLRALQIAEEQGIASEPSGIAGLAMLLQLKSEISQEERGGKRFLIVNTGKTKFQSNP